MKYKQFFFGFLCVLGHFSIAQGAKVISSDNYEVKCVEQLDFSIELWNKTGAEFLIGSVNDANEGYEKSTSWSVHGPYYPKKFDMKLKLFNRLKLEESLDTLNNWTLDVIMRFKVGSNKKGKYPLNHAIREEIKLIEGESISNSDFEGAFKYEIQVKEIEFEKYYLRHKSFINQIVFTLIFRSKESGDYCSYEYLFFVD